MKILAISAGTMGFELIKALAGSGHEMFICEADAAKIDRAATAGAIPVDSSREGAEVADASLLSLGTPEIRIISLSIPALWIRF